MEPNTRESGANSSIPTRELLKSQHHLAFNIDAV